MGWDGALPGCKSRDWPCTAPCSSLKDSSRDCCCAWNRCRVTTSVPQFCTRTVTVWGSPGTTAKRIFPLPWSQSEMISTPCFPRMRLALWGGRVRLSQLGWGIQGTCHRGVLLVIPLLAVALGHLWSGAELLSWGRRGHARLCIPSGSSVLVCHHHTPLHLQGAARTSVAPGFCKGLLRSQSWWALPQHELTLNFTTSPRT